MEGPRSPKRDEHIKVVDFLDKNLRPDSQWSISEEYPLAFDESNRNNIKIITSEEQIAAHAVVKNLVVKSVAGLFKVAAIGSVVTAPDHRSKGLSHKILTECLKSSKNQACDFAILWTDIYNFYRKLGFELAGSEVNIKLDAPLMSQENIQSQNLKFMNTSKISPDSFLKLYSNHTVGTVRNVVEIKKFLDIPNSTIHTAWNQGHQLLAYAVEGKGADLNGYIHEWGGNVTPLLALLEQVRGASVAPPHIICPIHSQGLIRKIQETNKISHSGFLGMIKILNPNPFFSKIKRYARNLGIDDLILRQTESGEFQFGDSKNQYKTTNETDLVRIIFGPETPSKLDIQSQSLEKIFPLPMWIWGWDSV